MDLSLKERFARLGPIRAVDRVSCGSPADLVLRLSQDHATLRTIDGMFALVRRGLGMLEAKHAIEAVVGGSRAAVHLPMVESHEALRDDLAKAGFAVDPVGV